MQSGPVLPEHPKYGDVCLQIRNTFVRRKRSMNYDVKRCKRELHGYWSHFKSKGKSDFFELKPSVAFDPIEVTLIYFLPCQQPGVAGKLTLFALFLSLGIPDGPWSPKSSLHDGIEVQKLKGSAMEMISHEIQNYKQDFKKLPKPYEGNLPYVVDIIMIFRLIFHFHCQCTSIYIL